MLGCHSADLSLCIQTLAGVKRLHVLAKSNAGATIEDHSDRLSIRDPIHIGAPEARIAHSRRKAAIHRGRSCFIVQFERCSPPHLPWP